MQSENWKTGRSVRGSHFCTFHFELCTDQYTMLESNQPTGLRRPSAATVGWCAVRTAGIEPTSTSSQDSRPANGPRPETNTEFGIKPVFSSFRIPHSAFRTSQVGETGVEPAISCFRRTRPLHLAHSPKLPARVPEAVGSYDRIRTGNFSPPSERSTTELRMYAPGIGRGQSVRRDLNPRVLGGNQAGCR